ncbi:MAG: ATP-dependent DNA helicase RecG, partial [Cytophagales bacterium]|nr:ATP-dependent DNA helicase RecG [Cytophagales bacterium]
FKISEVDLELRGPGDMAGTQQSGLVDLRIANLATDGEILKYAREAAIEILDEDEHLDKPENSMINLFLKQKSPNNTNWSKIS